MRSIAATGVASVAIHTVEVSKLAVGVKSQQLVDIQVSFLPLS